MQVCATPLELAEAEQWDEAWKFDLRQMAARFLCLNKGGQLSNARTEILPHQIFTAYTVVSNPKRRFMLADEVGLGKTVEAGMVWQALAQRGNAARTLVGRKSAHLGPEGHRHRLTGPPQAQGAQAHAAGKPQMGPDHF